MEFLITRTALALLRVNSYHSNINEIFARKYDFFAIISV